MTKSGIVARVDCIRNINILHSKKVVVLVVVNSKYLLYMYILELNEFRDLSKTKL